MSAIDPKSPVGPNPKHRRQKGRKEIQRASDKPKPPRQSWVFKRREEILELIRSAGSDAIHLSIDTENRADADVDQTTTSLIGNVEQYLLAHLHGDAIDKQREDSLSLIGASTMTILGHLRERMKLRMATVIEVKWTPALAPTETDDLTIRLGPAK